MCSVLVFSTVSDSYLRFPYLCIPSTYIRTCVFHTCIFHTCKMSCFILRFSVLVFSNTCDFSAPRETPEFIPPQLWSPKSQDLNPVDNSVWKILSEGVWNMHRWSGAIDDAADGWLPQWRRDPACSTPFSVTVSVRLDQWCVFFTSSLAIFLTLCNQLDSNLANLEATVAVG